MAKGMFAKVLAAALGVFSIISLSVSAQDLSGIWRGSFYNPSDMLLGGSSYRCEVQLITPKAAINGMIGTQGVTYSYQDKRFYGKASCMGIWNKSSKVLTMMEDKMLELKILGGGDGCLMTYYLEYRKEGTTEILEGTYTSVNMNNKSAGCGGGKVRLEKVDISDFGKEDFLEIYEAGKPKSNTPKVKPGQEDFLVKTPAPSPNPAAGTEAKPGSTTGKQPATKPPDAKPKTSSATASKPAGNAAKPPTQNNNKPLTNPAPKSNTTPPVATTPPSNTKPQTQAPSEAPKKNMPKPALPAQVKQRSNEVFDVINTDARTITLSLYDNGEVDGDIISVYHNNRLLAAGQKLSAKPLVYTIDLSDEEPDHEILVVAENLGSIPPNTALVIVQAGKERYNVRISSSEQKNAVIRFHYGK